MSRCDYDYTDILILVIFATLLFGGLMIDIDSPRIGISLCISSFLFFGLCGIIRKRIWMRWGIMRDRWAIFWGLLFVGLSLYGLIWVLFLGSDETINALKFSNYFGST